MRLFPGSPNAASGPDSRPGSGPDDVDLFARLLESHRDKLYRVAFRMTGHREEAEDLLQDALLEAYRSFQKFQRGTYFDKWLYRIMTNTFIDRQRHKKRVGTVESLDAPLPGSGETAARDIADPRGDPERLFLQNVFGQPLQQALDCLKPEMRLALILSDIEEFSYEEIAEYMGTPLGTVRSRLHRARDEVRKSLEKAKGRGEWGEPFGK